jgi:hypothetical protein
VTGDSGTGVPFGTLGSVTAITLDPVTHVTSG